MRAVLISIRPKWVEKIASGEKTIEVRKTAPKIQTPFKCYIYCTNDRELTLNRDFDGSFYFNGNIYYPHTASILEHAFNGKVVGEFVCDKIFNIDDWIYSDEVADILTEKNMCLSYKELAEYLNGKDGYGWHISNLKIYDKPKKLSEFHHFCTYPSNTCEDCAIQKLKPHCHYGEGLTRPPQSWQYIEEN